MKTAVAWCNNCNHYERDVNEVGRRCPGDCDEMLVLKTGYICSCCDEHFIHDTEEELKAHENFMKYF